MRIYNKTKLSIKEQIFISIAKEFNLKGNLPRAVNDEYGIYDTKQLKVIIQYAEKEPAYTQCCGCIELNCCSKCSSGFVTYNYIEAILHECLFQLLDNDCHPAESMGEDEVCKKLALQLFTQGFDLSHNLIIQEDVKCHNYPAIVEKNRQFDSVCKDILCALRKFSDRGRTSKNIATNVL